MNGLNGCRPGPCYYIGRQYIFFFITRKTNNARCLCSHSSHLVVLEDGQLDLLLLVLVLFGGGVVLLLPLLGPSSQAEDQMEGGLLLDVVVRECAAILQLFTGKDQPLLIRGNSCWKDMKIVKCEQLPESLKSSTFLLYCNRNFV